VLARWSATALVGVAFALATYLCLPRVLPSNAASGTLGAEARADSAEVNRESTRASAVASSEDLATTQKAVVQALLQARGEEPAAADPSVKAREIFDLRMANAAPDPTNTARMEQAIGEILASGVLGATTAETLCGATLCRLDLANADAAQLSESINALSEKLPKLFSRTLVVPGRDGARALYLATDPAALTLAPPSERQIVVPAPPRDPE
jgi:hypothetical protein